MGWQGLTQVLITVISPYISVIVPSLIYVAFLKSTVYSLIKWMLNAAGAACPAEWPADAAPTEARHPPSGAQLCAALAGVDHAMEAIYVWKMLRKLLEMLATCHSGLTPALGCEPAARRPSQQHAACHGSLENKTPTWNFN